MVGRRAYHRAPAPIPVPVPLPVTAPREPSPTCSAISSDWDADDEGAMSSGDNVPSRPLSVAIPDGPYYPRRPTLAEILSNSAPPPWTLSAFMAFLSQNHCLETLEFTMDASRYQRQYEDAMSSGPAPAAVEPPAPAREYVQMLWRRLLDAYIVPNGPREVNLPGDVRDQLLSLSNDARPPSPRSLEPAVKIIYDLMDESVLVPFLNSLSSPRTAPLPPPPPPSVSPTASRVAPWAQPAFERRGNDSDAMLVDSDESRHSSRSKRSRGRQDPSPTPSVEGLSSSVSSAGSGRRARAARHALTLGGNYKSSAGSGGSTASGDNLTDDSASPSSPGHEPMTPPTTPPTSDIGGVSPRGRTDRTWQKMTDRLRWRKKSSHNLREGVPPHSVEDEAGPS